MVPELESGHSGEAHHVLICWFLLQFDNIWDQSGLQWSTSEVNLEDLAGDERLKDTGRDPRLKGAEEEKCFFFCQTEN